MGGWWASVQQTWRSGGRVTCLPASCRECGPAAVEMAERKTGRKERRATQDKREVVCSAARGRGLDDANYRPLQPVRREGEESKRDRKRERQTCRRQRREETHPLL